MKTYDFIFGLGNACSCTQTLREADLQLLSFPFDWVILSETDDLRRRVETIANGFAGWFEKGDLRKIGDYAPSNRDIYRNEATGTVFNHEFWRNEDLDLAYPAVRAKYDRRIRRFLGLLAASQEILVVRVDRPDQVPPTSEAECREALRRLRALYPAAHFEMLHLAMKDGVSVEDRQVEDLGDGFVRVSCDYRNRAAGAEPYAVRFDVASTAVRALANVRDYRTHAEKAAFRRAKKRAHWAKYGADSAFGYRLEKWRRGWLLNVLPSMLRARVRRRKFSQIVPLGINCEVAFRFCVSWGFVDSSLFAWSQTFGLKKMCETLRKLDRLFAGAATLDDVSKMWMCEETGTLFHGRLKWDPGHPDYTDEQIAADLEDLRGRVRHLRGKFLDYLRNETPTLLVHRLGEGDAQKDDLDARLSELESVLGGLGARNCTLLVVVERRFLDRMPAGTGRVFRAVEKFNPCDCVTDVNAGDPIGWRAIYSEFAPAKILPKTHAFKFE